MSDVSWQNDVRGAGGVKGGRDGRGEDDVSRDDEPGEVSDISWASEVGVENDVSRKLGTGTNRDVVSTDDDDGNAYKGGENVEAENASDTAAAAEVNSGGA